ncbi:GIY-YIG nuclease family protein [Bacillus sp. FJAT-47783]|uniref:GIY-YIG nuclease family protein n=1 Tax=Bacillus sp. FJAT-47783 TaxID=2922712 RepID=UPI001FADEBDA|nr:GIY-YIG nuclease family protein [Bacillus sp. FJAT-47783]
MDQNSHYFYVLECSDGSYYAGYTNDLERRVAMHNKGKGAKYTRGRRPVKLIYNKRFETKQEAMSVEYYFKKLSRKNKEQYMQEGDDD